jgi:hypothetical protein
MNSSAKITLRNGLGDKFLDLIGFYVICKYLHLEPIVLFDNNSNFAWGSSNYDMRLFHFEDLMFSDKECKYYMYSHSPSSSLCPYKVYDFLKHYLPDVSFEQISNDFANYGKTIIKPTDIILSDIPEDIENTYGIHLRKTDKVVSHGYLTHESTLSEFDILINNLLDDITNIIKQEREPKFLLVSEDDAWKQEFKEKLNTIANNHQVEIKIIEIDYKNNDYTNYKSVLDMFSLSKCKEILQGVKYSSFSMLAALLGNVKLRNYTPLEITDFLTHQWSSVIEINNQKNFDIELHKKIARLSNNLETNICPSDFKKPL